MEPHAELMTEADNRAYQDPERQRRQRMGVGPNAN